MKKSIFILIVSSTILFTIVEVILLKNEEIKQFKKNANKISVNLTNTFKEKDIKNHYNKYVKTNKITKLITKVGNKYQYSGYLGSNVELELDEIKINKDTKFFKIKSLDEEYYIDYKNVLPIKEFTKYDDRFKNYIPFNENIITNDEVSFYNENNRLVYTFNKSYNLPIIIKNEDNYEVIFNNKLLKVKKSDIKTTIENHNSDIEKATQIPTILYHFIYDEKNEKCNEIICQSMSQTQSHINYLKENNYFILKMDEFEKFIDGKLNLPKKSILITVDDGAFGGNAKKIFTDNKINATLFVVSSWYNPHDFENEYLEVHSHSDNLHNTGVCKSGQGGGIQCLDKNTLLKDLKISREKTNNTVAFSYPFFEYNKYSIEVLKEAGFRLAFAGLYAGGKHKATVGYNKFEIPRITILNDTTVNDLKEAIS